MNFAKYLVMFIYSYTDFERVVRTLSHGKRFIYPKLFVTFKFVCA